MSMSIQIYGYTIDNFAHQYEHRRHWLKKFWAPNIPDLVIFNWTITLWKTKFTQKQYFSFEVRFLKSWNFWCWQSTIFVLLFLRICVPNCVHCMNSSFVSLLHWVEINLENIYYLEAAMYLAVSVAAKYEKHNFKTKLYI
jgi:hypothetical protein